MLAELPPEFRDEVLASERERAARQQRAAAAAATASSSGAPDGGEGERPAPLDMDNASFLATLTPDLREEILLTQDDAFIESLPPAIQAEAHALRSVSRCTGAGPLRGLQRNAHRKWCKDAAEAALLRAWGGRRGKQRVGLRGGVGCSCHPRRNGRPSCHYTHPATPLPTALARVHSERRRRRPDGRMPAFDPDGMVEDYLRRYAPYAPSDAPGPEPVPRPRAKETTPEEYRGAPLVDEAGVDAVLACLARPASASAVSHTLIGRVLAHLCLHPATRRLAVARLVTMVRDLMERSRATAAAAAAATTSTPGSASSTKEKVPVTAAASSPGPMPSPTSSSAGPLLREATPPPSQAPTSASASLSFATPPTAVAASIPPQSGSSPPGTAAPQQSFQDFLGFAGLPLAVRAASGHTRHGRRHHHGRHGHEAHQAQWSRSRSRSRSRSPSPASAVALTAVGAAPAPLPEASPAAAPPRLPPALPQPPPAASSAPTTSGSATSAGPSERPTSARRHRRHHHHHHHDGLAPAPPALCSATAGRAQQRVVESGDRGITTIIDKNPQ